MHECFVGSKILLSFLSAILFVFWILRKLKSTDFGFRLISAVNCCTKNHAFLLKTGEAYTISSEWKHYFEFPALSLLVNSDITSLILRQLSDNFAERFTIIKDQKVQFLTSNKAQQGYARLLWNFRECLFSL